MFGKIATAAAAAAAALFMAVPSANAATYAGVGSDTTQDVMRALTEEYATTVDPTNTWVSIDAGSTTQTIPGCTISNPAPNGSSAGINALLADSTGCIDYARSSRPLKTGTEQSTLTAVRLGGDSVSVAALPQAAGGHAPTNISLADIQKIYKCEITNWNGVTGGTSSDPIVRYLPQAGSGTRDFFITSVLGFDPTDLNTGSCTTQPTLVQENRGDAVATADRDSAILPYSKAAWTAQANSGDTGVPDHRAGFVLLNINGTAPGGTGFVGNRDVYNVYKTAGADPTLVAFLNWAAAQNDFKALYGFTA